MNDFMLTAYTNTKQLIYSEVAKNPIIWSEGDTLSLRFNNFRQDFNITPVMYDNLKMVAHAPFATFILLQPIVFLHHGNDSSEEFPLDYSTTEALTKYMQLVLKANASLASCCAWTEEQLLRQVVVGKMAVYLYNFQYNIMDVTLAFQQTILSKKTVSENDLRTFANSTVGWINLNVYDAVVDQLNEYVYKVG
jgi:hypothetical protein